MTTTSNQDTLKVNRNNFIDNMLELLPIEIEQQLDEDCWGIVGEMLGGFIINEEDEEHIIYQGIGKNKQNYHNYWLKNIQTLKHNNKFKMTKSMKITYKFLLDNKGTYLNQSQICKGINKYSYSTISKNLTKLSRNKYCYFRSDYDQYKHYHYDIQWSNDFLNKDIYYSDWS